MSDSNRNPMDNPYRDTYNGPVYGPETHTETPLYADVVLHQIRQRVPYTPEFGRTVQGETITSWIQVGDPESAVQIHSHIETREV